MKINGFTLIELIVIMLIIGILSVAAIPRMLGISHDVKKQTVDNIWEQMMATQGRIKSGLVSAGTYNPTSSTSINYGEIPTLAGQITPLGYMIALNSGYNSTSPDGSYQTNPNGITTYAWNNGNSVLYLVAKPKEANPTTLTSLCGIEIRAEMTAGDTVTYNATTVHRHTDTRPTLVTDNLYFIKWTNGC